MRQPTVIERRLKQSKRLQIFGKYLDGVVLIDPRQDEYQRLDTLLHELFHHVEEHYGVSFGEQRAETVAAMLTETLWAQGYRRGEK